MLLTKIHMNTATNMVQVRTLAYHSDTLWEHLRFWTRLKIGLLQQRCVCKVSVALLRASHHVNDWWTFARKIFPFEPRSLEPGQTQKTRASVLYVGTSSASNRWESFILVPTFYIKNIFNNSYYYWLLIDQ